MCSCLEGYIGTPPACRPECILSVECDRNQACYNGRCIDPCIGACGQSAFCEVRDHNPICVCPPGTMGNPFERCSVEATTTSPIVNDPCEGSPCGPNTQPCNGGQCTCLPEFFGDPYSVQGCQPECVLPEHCPRNKACIRHKCVDPCIGVCGIDAICTVINHSKANIPLIV